MLLTRHFKKSPSKSKNSSPDKYLVNTTNCKIIDWPLFDAQTLPLFLNNSGKSLECRSSDSGMLTVKRVNQTFIEIKFLSDFDPIPLCFATNIIRRRGLDTYVFLGKTVGPIKGSAHLPNWEAVRVVCYQTNSSVKSTKMSKYVKISETVVPLIPEKNLKTKKLETVEQNIPNVLMLGIESISWLQFRRHFSFTKGLAEKHGFHPMYGYTKIGDNTFPNLIAALTGQPPLYYWNETINETKYLDDVPFIWKEWSKTNYTTIFIEDYPAYPLFNFPLVGFIDPPTDYYLRTVSMAINHKLDDFCYKDQMEIQVN